jgi:phosphatidylglycerophosphate synthase
MTPVAAWPLATILAAEVSVGGLDNLLSHHRVSAGAATWGARVLGTSAILGAILLLSERGHTASLSWLAAGAAVLTVVGVGWEFWRGRDYYVDRRMREKALRETSPTDDT